MIGVGHLGRFHAQKYASMPEVELVGVHDLDRGRAEAVADELGTRAWRRLDDLLGQVDLVSVAVPTGRHVEVAATCLEAGAHVLLEKPMAPTVEEADYLIGLATRSARVLQVGHIERFNPALRAARAWIGEPVLVDAKRLSPFQDRGTDVSVVLDLMIHDLDILLDLVPSPVIGMQATGCAVLTRHLDVAQARLCFANGCVATLTASRVEASAARETHLYQPDSVLTLDYRRGRARLVRRTPEGAVVSEEEREAGAHDALLDELRGFVDAVRQGTSPPVTGEHGRRALALALAIEREILGPSTGGVA